MMEKKILSAPLWLLCIGLLLSACGDRVHEKGNGTLNQETRNVGAFFNIDVEGEFEIVLQEGSNPLIAVETDENLHQYVETVVDGRTLRVRNVENIEPSEQTRLVITYQSLESIRLGGAAQLSNQSTLKAENLDIRVDGAGVIDLSVEAAELEVRLAGAGLISLRGKVNSQRLLLSGAGNLAAFELESKDCRIELSGYGSAQIFVTDNLEAEISGVGGIRFKGDPRNIRREVSGLGGIERVVSN